MTGTDGPPSGWHPDWVVIPGETLDEELKERDIPQANLARATGYSAKQINLIVKGKARISPEFALALEESLGGPSAEFWCNLQAQHDLAVLRRNTESPKKEEENDA